MYTWTPNGGTYGVNESRLRGEFGLVDPAVDGVLHLIERGA